MLIYVSGVLPLRYNNHLQHRDRLRRASNFLGVQFSRLVRKVGSSVNHRSSFLSASSYLGQLRPSDTSGATTPWQKQTSFLGSDHRINPVEESNLSRRMHTYECATPEVLKNSKLWKAEYIGLTSKLAIHQLLAITVYNLNYRMSKKKCNHWTGQQEQEKSWKNNVHL